MLDRRAGLLMPGLYRRDGAVTKQQVANELAARCAYSSAFTKPISRWRIELRFDDVMNRAFKAQHPRLRALEGALLGWQETRCSPPGSRCTSSLKIVLVHCSPLAATLSCGSTR